MALSLSNGTIPLGAAAGKRVCLLAGILAGATVALSADARFEIAGTAQTGYRVVTTSTPTTVAGSINVDLLINGSVDRTLTIRVFDLATLAITPTKAARFLGQIDFVSTPTTHAAVMASGIDAALEAQLTMARPYQFWDRMTTQGYVTGATGYSAGRTQYFECVYNHALLQNPDTLRNRVGLALTNFLCVVPAGLSANARHPLQLGYWDILWNNALATGQSFRNILEGILLNPATAQHLTMNQSSKQAGAAKPDENLAREFIQLFSLGEFPLNKDGTVITSAPLVYGTNDVEQIARVLTGWRPQNIGNPAFNDTINSDLTNRRLPYAVVEASHETGAKTFLGVTIPPFGDPALPAGANVSITAYAAHSIQVLVNTVFNHPNLAPFVCYRLIQGLITSNPSRQYIERVSNVFENDGTGVRGNMRATVRAIMRDPEARNDAAARSNPNYGRVREPAAVGFALFKMLATDSQSDTWAFEQASTLGHRFGYSNTVFNDFKPNEGGFGTLASAGLVAPALRIINEITIPTWVNRVQVMLREGGSLNTGVNNPPNNATAATGQLDLRFNEARYLGLLATSVDALVDDIVLHTGNDFDAATIAKIKSAVGSAHASTAPVSNPARQQVQTALLLATACTQFWSQR